MISNQKKIWYILDEIAVKHSETHDRADCQICDRAIEALRLCDQVPSPEECEVLYEERKGKYERRDKHKCIPLQ